VIVSKDFATLPIALKGNITILWQLQVFELENLERVIGNGIHGSLNVLFSRFKHNNKLLKGYTTLIGLLTTYIEAKGSRTLVTFVK